MEQAGSLELVRHLTRLVVERLDPEHLPDFDAEFAVWALTAGVPAVAERPAPWPAPPRGLETTLVAGMFFQVLRESSRLPAGSQERVSFVRKKAKDYLVTHLAGQITLPQFYRLLNLIEEKVGLYFEGMADDWTGLGSPSREVGPPPPSPASVHGDALRRALAGVALPLKGRRKLTPESLWEFLLSTEGRWFRLLDLEGRFRVNKKTAWSYLNLLLQAGILEHNGEKANRVRYALAPRFRAAALEAGTE
jgi:hypothetical protein